MSWIAALPSENADASMPPASRQRTGRNSDRRPRGQGGAAGSAKKSNKLLSPQQMKQDLEDPFDLDEMKALFPVLLKLVLNNSMRIRQQDAILLSTLMVPEGLKPVVKAQARVRQWLAKSDTIRQEGGSEIDSKLAMIGSLSAACLAGIIEGLNEEGDAVGRANAAALRNLNGKLEQLQPPEVFEAIAFCKFTPAYAEGMMKLQFHIKNLDTKCIEEALVQLGGQKKQGVAPMSHLERVLHTKLSVHNGDDI